MNDLHEDAPYQDVFNWTLAPTKQAPYSLTGILPNTTLADTDMVVSMDSCNSSIETKDWLAWIIVMPWDETAGWNWTQPTVGLQFDSRTANFTLDGYFLAQPFIKENSTYQYLDEGNIRLASAKGPDVTMGKISIKFEGVIDSYHSDVLVNNSATPTWLKSVGFGNNSMNIGNGSTLSAGPRQSWVVAVFVVLFASMLMYI
ncbi:hypothetical protein N7462_000119 [Penicillium macrosclerotiorum]|uniref:uncharacterized protein n=1 Tax=Penicillium macrosclerotiorum TaxID=303699 RepID=UPI002548BABB|nr:uncharacterized protein N7462_000119 [Penicillium macrosclerotiorum]KAJ5698114.1 hypothetical protein N7462_000119 [Penicillium macrosclerotiorum]